MSNIYLSIDYGRRYIGTAIYLDKYGILPLITVDILQRKDIYDSVNHIYQSVINKSYDVKCIIVGDMSDRKKYLDIFLLVLENIFTDIPIEIVDERYTSSIASSNRRNYNLDIDLHILSAMEILERYISVNK